MRYKKLIKQNKKFIYDKNEVFDMVTDLMWEQTNKLKSKNDLLQSAIRVNIPLSSETASKLGVWNCGASASAWLRFLQDECIPVAPFHMLTHAEAISLFRNPETKKMVLQNINRCYLRRYRRYGVFVHFCSATTWIFPKHERDQ